MIMLNRTMRFPWSKRMGAVLISVILFFACATSGGATGGHAAGNDPSGGNAITGLWTNHKKDAKIRIYRCGFKYCGRIIWTKDGPSTDIKNPDPALRSRQILGLRILKDLSYMGKNRWAGGRLYDPKSGDTYTGRAVLVSPGRLRLRGYILIPIFGKTTTWTRVKNP